MIVYEKMEYKKIGEMMTSTMISTSPNNCKLSIMTEKEKMLAGMVYDATTPELIAELQNTREILYEFNMLRPSETLRMKNILKSLLGHTGDEYFLINQPFRCDYGKQISIGKRFFANFNFTVLDEARVTIGDECFIGPNFSIYTACHSTDPV